MREEGRTPQINLSKMPVGSGLAGGIFTVGSMAIFLIGIPALRYFLPAAAILGCLAAWLIRSARHRTTGENWILPSTDIPHSKK